MLKRGQGAIVNMSSIAGLKEGSPIIGIAYYASKHGVIGQTKAAANEYATQGLRINAVYPAVIETPMVEPEFSHNEKLTAKMIASTSDAVVRATGRGRCRDAMAMFRRRILCYRSCPYSRWWCTDMNVLSFPRAAWECTSSAPRRVAGRD